jgi:cyanophycin synthetase
MSHEIDRVTALRRSVAARTPLAPADQPAQTEEGSTLEAAVTPPAGGTSQSLDPLPRTLLVESGQSVSTGSLLSAGPAVLTVEVGEDSGILGSCGLPVPRQEVVRGVEQAVSAAEKLKFPVVTKPNYGNHGRGISIGLMTPQEVRAGFSAAAKYSGYVIVESFVPGADYRLLVVNGELIAASRRTPAQVVGDGAHTIRELVSIANQDPRRGIGQERPLTRLELDPQTEDTLARQGLTLDSKPLAGQMVPLRSTANLSTGGTATDVTDIIHPDNRDLAICAVTAIGLDVGGVDFICPDITASHKKIGGSICEVNAAPGLRMHMAPSAGAPRDAAGAVIDMLFPPGVRSCVPIVCITGIQGNTAISRVFARIAKSAGFSPGLATADGIYIDGSRTAEGDATDSVAAHMVLADARIDIAVLEISRDGLQRAGLGVRSADVGAVVHVGAQHLGPQEIENLDQFAEFERIVVAVTRDCVVLNADDERTARLSMHARAKHLCYVTANPQHSVVYEHIKNGGRACTLEANAHGKMITLHDNGSNTSLLSAHLVPPKLEGRTMCSIQDVMFAVALAFSINIKLDAIRHGLHSLGIPLSLP